MRLNQSEVEGIIASIEKYRNRDKVILKLYGSRVDDTAKGGDIDLLLIATNKQSKNQLSDSKHHILALMKENIGDRKIDLLITCHEDIEDDSFVQMILPSSVTLKEW